MNDSTATTRTTYFLLPTVLQSFLTDHVSGITFVQGMIAVAVIGFCLLFAYLLVTVGKDTHPWELGGKTWSRFQWVLFSVLMVGWLALYQLPEGFRWRTAALSLVALSTVVIIYLLWFPRTETIAQALPPPRSWIWQTLEWSGYITLVVLAVSLLVTILRYQTDEMSWPIFWVLRFPCWIRDQLILGLHDVARSPTRAILVLVGSLVGLFVGLQWLRHYRQHHHTDEAQRMLHDSAIPGGAIPIDIEERSLSRARLIPIAWKTLGQAVKQSGAWSFESTWQFPTRQQVSGLQPVMVAQLSFPSTSAWSLWFDPSKRQWLIKTYVDRSRFVILDWPWQRWTTLLVRFGATHVDFFLDGVLKHAEPVGVEIMGTLRPEDWSWELLAPTGVYGFVRSVQAYKRGEVVMGLGRAG